MNNPIYRRSVNREADEYFVRQVEKSLATEYWESMKKGVTGALQKFNTHIISKLGKDTDVPDSRHDIIQLLMKDKILWAEFTSEMNDEKLVTNVAVVERLDAYIERHRSRLVQILEDEKSQASMKQQHGTLHRLFNAFVSKAKQTKLDTEEAVSEEIDSFLHQNKIHLAEIPHVKRDGRPKLTKDMDMSWKGSLKLLF